MASDRAAIHRIYDDENCPRGDGGRLMCQDLGREGETDPNDPMPSRFHFSCSTCGKWWHPIELRRRPA